MPSSKMQPSSPRMTAPIAGRGFASRMRPGWALNRCSSRRVEDRRKSEADLLDEYRKALEVPDDHKPTADQIWARYRATPIYGLAIWLSTLGTDGWQPREISLTLCRRFSAAFTELDTLQPLRNCRPK